MPCLANSRKALNSLTFCGALIPWWVHQRIKTRAPNQIRRIISSCWRSPTVERIDVCLRIKREAELLGQLLKILLTLRPAGAADPRHAPG